MGARAARATSEDDQHPHQHGAQGAERPSDGPRRIEVITGSDRRRRWTKGEKARITAERFAPGETVAGVSRSHGMSLGLPYYWRRCARQGPASAAVSFVPILPAAAEGAVAADRPARGSGIEIERSRCERPTFRAVGPRAMMGRNGG